MLNHIVIMGRLTRDPELRYTGSNIPVASFTVAVDRDFGNKETGEKQTDFINCSAWRSTGEFVSKYFTKGSMIVVSGRLQMRDYTDRDGNKRTAAEIQADNVYFGESKKRDGGDWDNGSRSGGYSNDRSGGYSSRSSSSRDTYTTPSRKDFDNARKQADTGFTEDFDDGDLPF